MYIVKTAEFSKYHQNQFYLNLWSLIISSPSLGNFRDPDSAVFSTEKTCLRPAQTLKNSEQSEFFSVCAPVQLLTSWGETQ
jgi:hypothetical protein